MTIIIVTQAEVEDALRGQKSIASEREHALNELAALREWFAWPDAKKEWGGNPQYPLELLDEIEHSINHAWPKPVTLDELQARILR